MPVLLLTSYQTSGSAQRSAGEPRQAGNGATVARRQRVLRVSPESGQILRDEAEG